MSNELTYEIDPGETVTHFYGADNSLYCLDLRCATKNMTASAADARDFDDEDCHGSYVECSSCGEYLFPAAAAAEEAERDAMMRQIRRDAPIYRAEALARKQQADPVGFYLACKNGEDV